MSGIAAQVERDGFLVVAGVIGAAEADELISALDRAGADPAARARRGGVYAIRDLLRVVPEVRALAASAAVRGLVVPVLGPGAFAVRGLLFDKTEGANWNVPWHRDETIAVRDRRELPGFGPWTTKVGVSHVRPPRPILERMLTVRLHLDDCGPDNGPLRVLPGSHVGARGFEPADRCRAVTCPVPRGGALVMRPLILHASSESRRPDHRRVIHLEFAAEPLPGGLDWLDACA
ncbi:MAG TPA: phytanoyl-CoA dioxygenase family protein [Isosphaeraceae bacterium]|jgi:ectoine hydroxylase-related dioxygenase (phytanoyl-CoA dioxygenase family)|nr:phytanoyl-CoA dioxygenase family protein [Isosphaeraceae bacterium]